MDAKSYTCTVINIIANTNISLINNIAVTVHVYDLASLEVWGCWMQTGTLIPSSTTANAVNTSSFTHFFLGWRECSIE